MSDRVTLPSGAWVEFQDGATATEGQRRPLRKLGMRMDDPDSSTADEADIMVELTDLGASIMITRASFVPDGQKCTVDDIVGLLGRDYDALIGLVAPRLGAFLQGINFDPSPDPKAPTEPSPG